jgi:hypothetical protein
LSIQVGRFVIRDGDAFTQLCFASKIHNRNIFELRDIASIFNGLELNELGERPIELFLEAFGLF